MITDDPATRDAGGLRELSDRYEQPILSVHAPVLPLAQLVWGSPESKLRRSAELAVAVGASTVVVHPPFRWQPRYASGFAQQIRSLAAEHEVEVAVENMFPLTLGRASVRAFSPSSDPVLIDCDAITLDFSHAAMAGRDSLELALSMGDRLRHIHLTDGTISMAQGQLHDEHLIPGTGTQPVAEVLQHLAHRNWSGSVVAEVNTRPGASVQGRLAMLRKTVEFAATHLSGPPHGPENSGVSGSRAHHGPPQWGRGALQ